MKQIYFSLHILLFISLLNFNLYSQPFGQEPTERKSNFDVQHIKLDISVDPENKFVTGKTYIKLVPAEINFSQFELDAVGMNINNVELDPKGPMIISYSGKTKRTGYYLKTLKYDYNKTKLKIYLDSSYTLSDTLNLIIHYNTTDPEKGLYFVSPTAEFPNKRYEVWSQGEGEDNRYWFPCYDYPNDKATTEIIVTADKKYQTISNGVIIKKEEFPEVTKWHWVNDQPHSAYLVMLGIGTWDTISTSWDGIPIISYVPPGMKQAGENAYRQTADIVKFFSEYTGFRYPWHEFRQVAVQDFIYGGMENTGAVVLFEGSVHDASTEPDYSATGLVAHELAHQWWGDVTTCKNWNEIWLNESFATYFQCLYKEHELGKDEFDYNIYNNGINALNADSTQRIPIYTRSGPGANTYDKGSVVLNMLRNLIGDEKFRKTMNIYITDNAFKPVVTKDLLDALHKAVDDPMLDQKPSNYSWFFEEWIYSAGQPEIKADYSFDEKTNELTINAVQVQRLDTSSVFRTHFPVEIITSKGIQNIFMQTSTEPSSFKIKLTEKPLNVNFNKGNKVLCKLYFTKPKSDWLYQLKYSPDAIDRITALNGLKDYLNDDSVIDFIKQDLRRDSFWGVRYEAVKILAGSMNPKVVETYMKYMIDEPDPRVRRAYLLNLNKVLNNHPEEKKNTDVIQYFLTNLIKYEPSKYAAADAINALGQILEKGKIYDAVIPFIDMDSHVDIVRRNILSALERSGDPRAKEVFLKYAVYGSTARVRNIAINAFENYLNDPEVIELLNNKVLDNTRSTQNTILRLIEKAKNPSSKPFLEKLYNNSNDDRFKERVNTVIKLLN